MRKILDKQGRLGPIAREINRDQPSPEGDVAGS